jgi:hypothetical protein
MVLWLDSCEPEPNSDLTIFDLPEPQLITSLGFLIRDADEHITIAGNHKVATEGKDDHTWDYVTTIPKCSIRATHKLGDTRIEQEVFDNQTQ